MRFCDIHPNGMSLLLTFLFLNLCACCVCLQIMLNRKWIVHAVAMGLCLAVNLAVLTLYGANMNASLVQQKTPPVVLMFSELPLSAVLAIILVSVTVQTYALIREFRYRKNSITHSAIKESVDHLNTALCFYRPNGMILLTNYAMVSLGFAIAGKEVQNGAAFWETLRSGDGMTSAERLSGGNTPEYRLPDGSIWTFRREVLDDVIQLTAADTTQLHRLMDALRKENRELRAMCQRIWEYGEKVDRYVISKERLETRVNLHSYFGQALLTTRHFIQYGSGSLEQIIGMWHRNIDVLKLEAEPQTETDSFSELKANAQVVGISVETTGVLPAGPSQQRLLALAGVEAVINAGKHGEARKVWIEIGESEEAYIARYTNDGAAPDAQVVEGGGLSALRTKIERAGGEMHVQSMPEFVLTVILRKEETAYV